MEDPPSNFPIDRPNDPVTALSQVRDDVDERLEAHQWAAESLLNGHTPEQLLLIMLDQGWDQDKAEEIIESARKETRSQRGVVTRDDIIASLNMDYRQNTAGLRLALRGGLFGIFGSLFAFARGFLAAMRSREKLKRLAQKK